MVGRRDGPVRVQVVSDLHHDEVPARPRLAPGADLVVVAGDVMRGVEGGFALLRDALGPDVPIAAVAGNHEFWGRCLEDERAAGRAAAARHGVAFLDDDAVVVAGVRLLGCTLWTDYALGGVGWRGLAMSLAEGAVKDHREIRAGGRGRDAFRAADALALHQASRAFLAGELARPSDGPTVVVTHHAPSALSVARRYEREAAHASAWVASDLTDLMLDHAPALWVHGHCHASCDYVVGDTRVVCNPRGYGSENPDFDPVLVVEV